MPYKDPEMERARLKRRSQTLEYKAYQRAYYLKHGGSQKARRPHTAEGFKQRVLQRLKEHTACARCGYNERGCSLAFHHEEKKRFPISLRSIQLHGWSEVLDEMDRCIVLCHNCHQIFHSDYGRAAAHVPEEFKKEERADSTVNGPQLPRESGTRAEARTRRAEAQE